MSPLPAVTEHWRDAIGEAGRRHQEKACPPFVALLEGSNLLLRGFQKKREAKEAGTSRSV